MERFIRSAPSLELMGDKKEPDMAASYKTTAENESDISPPTTG